MHRYLSHIFIILGFLCTCLRLQGQNTDYRQFSNIRLVADASVVSCFLQDSEGMMWIGSNKGLFSYDGYSAQAHFTFGEQSNAHIYCGVIIDNTYLYLGTDNGILVYNYRTDCYENPGTDFPSDVRTMALQNETLWIGTLNGLYTYQWKKKTLNKFDKKKSQLPHSTIYAILHTTDNQIYIGTYNGLCRYQEKTHMFVPVLLPVNRNKNNQFVNSLLEDTQHSCIWIGTEGCLFKYIPQKNKMEQVEIFHNNSIKSMALDNNSSLLVGTDNGLYTYSKTEDIPRHIVHDSRNANSLSNNIIWSIFADKEHNIWLGTDYDISLARYNSALRHIPISQITGTGEGNLFYSIFRDSRGFYWLGGTNGLIRCTSLTETNSHVLWYKMGDNKYPLSHNRIRHIYEDKDKQLWIATDGSIHRYDYTTQQFIHYNIVDRTNSYNTNWAYYLYEDNSGNLWISTCLGGVFVVNKQKLMASGSKTYIAEQNYSIRNGLSGIFINQLTPDPEGNVWVLLYNNNGLNKINPHTHQVSRMFVNELSGKHSPNYLLSDHNGFLWVGFRGGVMRIRPKDSTQRSIRFGAFGKDEVLSMMEADGYIWISTTNGLWTVHQQTMDVRQINLTDKCFTSLFFDSHSRQIYLGESDGIAISQPEILNRKQEERPILFTALYINNQLSSPHVEKGPMSIRYLHQLELNHKQNNLAFEISDLPYSPEEKNEFVYKLEGQDQNWNYLQPNTNRITYSNLNYGNYQLIVKKLNSNGMPSNVSYTLDIRITSPWYYTTWSKAVYFIIIISLIAWIINFFRVKNHLKAVHIEKEKILEQSRLKIDFFTNLSNELKTPLSHILAPISKLIPSVGNPQEKQTLENVQRNAMKINSLLHQMLDISQIENAKDSLLILSRIELVSFAHSLFSLYEEDERYQKLHFIFETNVEKIYVDMDAIKLGTILNNLLSNATKFTPQEGSIRFTLFYQNDSKQLDISIIDTGIGIPQQDIPHIFQRFFQSPHIPEKKEGTGMGLYLVKTYTELHGGHIHKVISTEGEGTTIRLTIPAIAIEEESNVKTDPSHSTTQPETLTILKPIEAESQDEKFLTKIIKLIEDHIDDSDLNVNALCELSDTSNKQIYRKLKQLTGMTPVEYIKSIRMKKAAMLLQQKKFTVAEVMYMVGFSNHSYFSKCFQSEFGKTPKEYINDQT